jgi:hypothetical protein
LIKTDNSMRTDLRNVLDTAYERLRHIGSAPAAFASNYALCLGVIMGGEACKGLSREEAAIERAHLSMLAAMFEIQLGVRTDFDGH